MVAPSTVTMTAVAVTTTIARELAIAGLTFQQMLRPGTSSPAIAIRPHSGSGDSPSSLRVGHFDVRALFCGSRPGFTIQ